VKIFRVPDFAGCMPFKRELGFVRWNPASNEFSINSFTIETGRSMISPAAILLTISSGKSAILLMSLSRRNELRLQTQDFVGAQFIAPFKPRLKNQAGRDESRPYKHRVTHRQTIKAVHWSSESTAYTLSLQNNIFRYIVIY
jgi:hypothetical protein